MVHPTTGGSESSANLAGWIDAARKGSQEALGQVLEACRQYLLLVANQYLDADLQAKIGASDVVQDTFLEAQRDFGRFHGRTEEELLAWLRTILLNNLANVSRHYRATEMRQIDREVPLAGIKREKLANADGESPSGHAMAREQADKLERALEQLSEDHRAVIALRHQEQLAFEEIGQRLGRSAEAARNLWMRAVDQLQQLLETPDEPP